jgi:hypothetical protein
LRSARAWRIGGSLDMVELLPEVPELLVVPAELCGIGAVAPDVPDCGMVPVAPIGPPAGLCWPAPVAGFGDAVVGGLPCAKAMPAAPSARAAIKLEVRFMAKSPEG